MKNNIPIAQPRSKKTIINIVNYIKEQFDCENNLYFPVVCFADLILQKLDKSYSFSVCEYNEMPDKYAYYDPANNEMVVRSDVYDLACKDDGRHRFTIAHEVGHYFLHRQGIAFSRASGDYPVAAYRNIEWQANTFASELLMPSKLIRGLNAVEVQRLCCVSGQAAVIALDKAKKPS